MKLMMKCLVVLAAMAGAGFAAAPAHAQATRTWVSGVGDDANPCSRTAPCKTFAGAISKTATNGEINCLDPGGYGAVTITKSITIDCTGQFGSTLVSGTNGIIVNGAGIVVRLRGLAMNGLTSGLNGVRIFQAGSVTIENCFIYGFNGSAPNGFGIFVDQSAAGDLRLYVNNSTISGNGVGNTGGGLGIFPSGGAVNIRAELNNVQFLDNTNSGITVNTANAGAGSSVSLSVENSRFAGNGGVAIAASSGANGPIGFLVEASALVNNTTGLVANGAATTGRVGGTTITGNALGVLVVGGATVSSYGNNRLDGNPTVGAANNGAFSGVVPTK